MSYLFVLLMASAEGVPIEVKIGFENRAACEALQPTVVKRIKIAAYFSGAKVIRSECLE